jgi:hypothetical protein
MSSLPPKTPPSNMGPFGNDDEVTKLMKYGLEFDRKRLLATGMLKAAAPSSPALKENGEPPNDG